ncbi:hypothetical protein WJX81_008051 [Elliptochloris bilobata]|uniref:Glycosyltransferase family 92 protein n=1 Tax=Elliptochloris bilobata TaxID=381761 RepID=A0AAW1RH03_9CHLO
MSSAVHSKMRSLLTVALLAYISAAAAFRHTGAHRHNLQDASHTELPSVAICVLHKDQNEDVEEWLDYHLGLGVSKVFFMDNNSTVPIREALSKYESVVHYEDVFNADAAPLNQQMYAYKKCLEHKDEVAWMAFIDVDEFIVLKTKEHWSLPQLLMEYKDEGALAMNWVMFGSNSHVRRPEQHTLHAYTRCIQPHPTRTEHIKTIVNTAHVADISGDPHHFHYVEGKTAVNENHVPVVNTPFTEGASVSKIACHHYVLKSLEDFSHKIKRGSGDGGNTSKNLDWFIAIDSMATAYCTPGSKFNI